MNECIGCGERIWTEANLHQSGIWCRRGGRCEIKDFEGVNRLREAVIELMELLDTAAGKEDSDR